MATILAFHAHPDDEVLLTGGTIARLAAEGHRVVIVVACDGAMWPTDGTTRLAEFRTSAEILGAARALHLGYADSGHGPDLHPDPPDRVRFVRADVGEAAERLAAIIRQEDADLLLSYDPRGCYGHRDHIRVHEVGARAAKLTGIRVLEATVPRELAVGGIAVLRALRLVVRFTMQDARDTGTPWPRITHRVNVRRYAEFKQAALAAHVTPVQGKGRSARLFRFAVALPIPIFGLLAGWEWFAEPDAEPDAEPGRAQDPVLGALGGRKVTMLTPCRPSAFHTRRFSPQVFRAPLLSQAEKDHGTKPTFSGGEMSKIFDSRATEHASATKCKRVVTLCR